MRIDHLPRAQKKAAPRLIQKLSSKSVLQATEMMKLVEWPVVDSVPARFLVLYKGISHTVVWYTGLPWTGLKWMTGTSLSITPGGDSLAKEVLKSTVQA